jgi:hypothetical protein
MLVAMEHQEIQEMMVEHQKMEKVNMVELVVLELIQVRKKLALVDAMIVRVEVEAVALVVEMVVMDHHQKGLMLELELPELLGKIIQEQVVVVVQHI